MAEPPLDSVLSAGVASQLPEVSREEILRQIFGDVGELIDDFTCAVESTVLIHGRLYVTSKFICFYSNLFGLEKKIRIPYAHIKGITKENTAMVIPNAIAIATDKKSYTFRSFWDRDECHRMLNLFLQRFRSKEPLRGIDASGSTRRNSANMTALTDASEAKLFSSAPLPADGNSGKADAANNGDDDLDAEPVVRDRRGTSSTRMTASQSPTVSDKDKDAKRLSSSAAVAELSSDGTGRRGSRAVEPSNEDVMDYETGLRPESVRMDLSKVDWALKFEQELSRVKLKLVVVQEQTLNISLDEFYKLFLDNSAPMSIKKYHQMVNDNNLQLSTWEAMSQSLGHGRELRFFKPVNLPGLASTRGIKIQRCVRFGDYGLIVCSSTRLEDVPAADTFSVDDVLSVKSVDAKKVSFEITFQVSFVKSTFMKYIIERSTNTEMSKWLENFATQLKKSVEEYRSGSLTLSADNSSSPREKSDTIFVTEKPSEPSAAEVAKVVSSSTTSTPSFSSPSEFATSTATAPSFPIAHYIIVGLVVLLVVLLFVDLSRWRHIESRIEAINSKLNAVEDLVNSLAKNKLTSK